MAAVLAAGLFHALWNAIVKNFLDLRDSFALINLGVFATCVVTLPIVGLANRSTYVFLAVAMVLHQLYELVLMVAYRHGDLSKSYPIARGVAPLLVSLGGFVFAGEKLGVVGALGLLVIVAGITLLAGRSLLGASSRQAVLWALATGTAIATYTVIDGFGVRAGHSALQYGTTLFLLQSLSWTVAVSIRRGWSWMPPAPKAVLGMGGGILSMIGYFIVLWAQTKTAMGSVSALRETGVLWAAVIGAVFFKEGRLRRLAPPAALVVGGVILLSLA